MPLYEIAVVSAPSNYTPSYTIYNAIQPAMCYSGQDLSALVVGNK